MPPEFTFFEESFKQLVNQPSGGVARELLRVGREVAEETKQHLSTPRPSMRFGEWVENRSKIPWTDTGDLMRSVRASLMFDVRDRTIAVGITAGAVHGGVQYSAILLEQDFILAPPRITNR